MYCPNCGSELKHGFKELSSSAKLDYYGWYCPNCGKKWKDFKEVF